MTRPSFKFGTIAGVILSVVFLAPFVIFKGESMYSFFHVSEIIGYSTMILSMLFVFFGIRSYRDTELAGSISFGKAFLTGLLIAFVASVIFGIFTIILYKFISPNLGNEIMDHYKRSIIESGKSKEIIDAQLSEMESYRDIYNNVVLQGLLMFATVFFIGIIISLISSFILKRKKA